MKQTLVFCGSPWNLKWRTGKGNTLLLLPLCVTLCLRQGLKVQWSLNEVDTLAAAGALFSDASASWRLTESQLAVINGRLADGDRQAMKWKHACQDGAGRKVLCAACRGEGQGQVSMARIRFAESLSGTAPPTLRLLSDE